MKISSSLQFIHRTPIEIVDCELMPMLKNIGYNLSRHAKVNDGEGEYAEDDCYTTSTDSPPVRKRNNKDSINHHQVDDVSSYTSSGSSREAS